MLIPPYPIDLTVFHDLCHDIHSDPESELKDVRVHNILPDLGKVIALDIRLFCKALLIKLFYAAGTDLLMDLIELLPFRLP